MQMPKATDADKDRFRSLAEGAPGVEVKPMFGQLGAFVNGNMFAGLFGSSVGVKLDDDSRAELEAGGGTGPFGPEERPMPGYLSLPAGLDDTAAATWVERARAHVATFPPKVRKPKAR
jgi:TfoX/Sxy family transcriptional regulator of competence genes